MITREQMDKIDAMNLLGDKIIVDAMKSLLSISSMELPLFVGIDIGYSPDNPTTIVLMNYDNDLPEGLGDVQIYAPERVTKWPDMIRMQTFFSDFTVDLHKLLTLAKSRKLIVSIEYPYSSGKRTSYVIHQAFGLIAAEIFNLKNVIGRAAPTASEVKYWLTKYIKAGKSAMACSMAHRFREFTTDHNLNDAIATAVYGFVSWCYEKSDSWITDNTEILKQ